MFVFSPEGVRRIEDTIRYEIVNQWEKAPDWDSRLMGVEPVSGLSQTIQFREPSVKIYKLGPNGAGMIYDPLVYKQMRFTPEPVGNGLQLFARQMDNRMSVGINMAGDWAEEVGYATAYYSIRGCVELLQEGLGTNPRIYAFDGEPLFSKTHPIGGGSDLTYSNEHNGMPFNAQNLALAWAYISQLRHGGDAPRGLEREGLIVVLPTNYKFRGDQALRADWYSDVLNAQAAAVNTLKTGYGFQEPIIAPEFTNFPDTWYVCAPAGRKPTNSGGVMVQQQPFAVNTYTHLDQVTLGQSQQLEYHNRAWLGFQAGQPYYWHRFSASGAVDSYMQAILDNF